MTNRPTSQLVGRLAGRTAGITGGAGGDIETLQDAIRDVHPTHPRCTPDDLANLVNWLAFDEARYASGQLWVLDGGLATKVQQLDRPGNPR